MGAFHLRGGPRGNFLMITLFEKLYGGTEIGQNILNMQQEKSHDFLTIYRALAEVFGTRPVAMDWHGVANAPLNNTMPAFCHPWRLSCNILLLLFLWNKGEVLLKF